MDVERITEELYGLKPADFVAARDAYVAEARKAKDAPAAKAIAALRKPSTAAWASNRLARERREEAQRFLALGETLREAHRTLDAERLRAASREQHQVVTALARTAAELAREAGQPVSDTVVREIEQTLHGVLAHRDVADLWSKGRLVKVPEAAVDFTAIAPETVPPRPAQAERQPERHPDLERARAATAEADAEVARREREFDEAQRARQAAATQAEEAAERVARLEADLEEARQSRLDAETTASNAATALTTAKRALAQSRRAADRATRTAERLEDRAP
ncbi:hypothetical protein [Streptomyces sp. NPDC056549]|uniref:hypothetical protein n=1 Tax=Streptomyces sp. NPDC056549 TaxID=3345864 RepID=UPI003681733F